MLGADAGVEGAHDRCVLRRRRHARSQLRHPVVLTQSALAAVEEGLDRARRPPDSVIAPGTRAANAASAPAAAWTKIPSCPGRRAGRRGRRGWRRAPTPPDDRAAARPPNPELPPHDVRRGEVDFADEQRPAPGRHASSRQPQTARRPGVAGCRGRAHSRRSAREGNRARRQARTAARFPSGPRSAPSAAPRYPASGTPAPPAPSPPSCASLRPAARVVTSTIVPGFSPSTVQARIGGRRRAGRPALRSADRERGRMRGIVLAQRLPLLRA